MIDVYSRYAYAKASNKASAGQSINFFKTGQRYLPFSINCTQSDHGPEFGSFFTRMLNIRHRHARVRKPNDNAHLERFNRTIQEELLTKLPKDVEIINKAIPEYLEYYNTKRKHLGLGLLTPDQMLQKCFQAKVV